MHNAKISQDSQSMFYISQWGRDGQTDDKGFPDSAVASGGLPQTNSKSGWMTDRVVFQ